MDIIAKIVDDVPKFHCNGETTWAVNENVLREIQRHVKPGLSTLETGCGLSTVLFCLSECKHVCITPAKDETDRVKAYCKQQGFSTDNLRFEIGSSDEVLPRIAKDLQLDFVFIDGAHRFPYPELDFHYVESRLRIGGMVVVDDVQIPSVNYLYKFLQVETEWESVSLVQNTAFFRKLREPGRGKDWCDQKMNDAQMAVEQAPLVQRAIRKAKRMRGRWI